MSTATIEQEIESLRATMGGGNGAGRDEGDTRDGPSDGDAPIDPEVYAACNHKLNLLRQAWRENPEWFGPDAVAMLRTISGRLRRRSSQQLPLMPQVPRFSSREAHQAAQQALKDVFGFDSFRPGQEEIITAVLGGRDCIGVMPTGAGKSLTYQIPARLLGGTTLVVSPLIALMKDQVDAMTEAGLRATFLNSSLSFEQRRERLQALWAGAYELVYAAPEGLEAATGSALARARLSLIAIDEAHCISHWGHDFRPAYRNLAGLKRRFGGLPVLALTATATPDVTRDIVEQLAMVNPAEYRGSFFRPNLNLAVYRKGSAASGGDGGGDGAGRGESDARAPSVRTSILRLVRAHPGMSGIIYCLSRKATETTAEFLRSEGIRADAYHAGLAIEDRTRVQDAFRRDQIDVVVATVAFGMGIDKPDIRYVIHRDMPRSIEGYYQEIGRAGRDGLPSNCILFYSWADVVSYSRFTSDGPDDLVERQMQQAREMFRLADERGHCRHRLVTAYLGERIAPCGSSCDVCSERDVLAATPPLPGKRRRRGGGLAPSGEQTHAPDALDPAAAPADAGLYERLRRLRRQLADSRGIPAYMIFSDATLLDMARRRPRTPEALLDVSGVGPRKLEQYGQTFLDLLCQPA